MGSSGNIHLNGFLDAIKHESFDIKSNLFNQSNDICFGLFDSFVPDRAINRDRRSITPSVIWYTVFGHIKRISPIQ